MTEPLTISIAMATYNGERFLAEQLESFVQQTRRPDELVVCDDGSQDATVSILEAFAARAPFPVRIYINPQNLGFAKNFEKAAVLCQGDIIAFSDQDDVWLPEKLARFEQVFQERPQVGYVFSDAKLVDENLQPLGCSVWEALGFTPFLQIQFTRGAAFQLHLKDLFINGCQMGFRSDLREIIFPIPADWSHDRWICFLMSIFVKSSIIPEQLLCYRQHFANLSGSYTTKINGKTLRKKVKKFKSRKNKEHYEKLIFQWLEARRHITEKLNMYSNIPILYYIDEKIIHLNAKAQMPSSRLRRIPFILREIINGRYQCYCYGWNTITRLKRIAKDLLA